MSTSAHVAAGARPPSGHCEPRAAFTECAPPPTAEPCCVPNPKHKSHSPTKQRSGWFHPWPWNQEAVGCVQSQVVQPGAGDFTAAEITHTCLIRAESPGHCCHPLPRGPRASPPPGAASGLFPSRHLLAGPRTNVPEAGRVAILSSQKVSGRVKHLTPLMLGTASPLAPCFRS